MGVYKSKSSLNNHSVKYLLRVFKTESLKQIWEKITFSYVVDDFFQSDQFLPIYSSGKFVEQRFCDSYFGKHLTWRAAIFYNAYHDAYFSRVFKIESLKNIWEKITFSYVADDFIQSDQFLPIYSSGKFVELRFCDSYFGKHLTCGAAIFYNAYHDTCNAWSDSPLFVENLSLVARWKSKTLL